VAATYPDLEIRLSHRYAGGYSVELRLSQPESEGLDHIESNVLVTFEPASLRDAAIDAECYGDELTRSLFADPEVKGKFVEAAAAADKLKVPLRVRLFVTRSAPDLHELRWETLRHPVDGTPLASSDRVHFSRYLSSADWRSVRRQRKSALKALVAVANPTEGIGDGDGQWPLKKIDVAGEINRAKAALGSEIPLAMLRSGVTLDAVTAQVREHNPDLLYLVCHGGRDDKGNPILFLEGKGGTVDPVGAAELVEQLRILEHRLRLVVLASCRSAGSGVIEGAGGALAALGPLLAEAGVPAVVAMQGDVSMSTVATFMPEFFAELRRHGEIDRAMARARNVVRGELDAWMPVLFLRLKNGSIWYEPGFGDEDVDFERWPALMAKIDSGRCIPIVGSGAADAVFGSRQEIARTWANKFSFPLAPHDRDSLPRVAQFLTVNQEPEYPLTALEGLVKRHLKSQLGAKRRKSLARASLNEIASVVGRDKRKSKTEPHRVLAELGLPIYVTANPDNLLADALRDAGREPEVDLFHWFEDPEVEWPPSVFDRDPTYIPSPERPLVYHLMGHLDFPRTPVLTEDDYFRYLIGAAGSRAVIPRQVRGKYANSALLFVGFQMDDWDFRVIYWSVVSGEAELLRRRNYNVGVQVAPDEDRFPDAEAARKHLAERYFDLERVTLYWGTPQDFAQDLWEKWQAYLAEQEEAP
jgi:hypothetical protein